MLCNKEIPEKNRKMQAKHKLDKETLDDLGLSDNSNVIEED